MATDKEFSLPDLITSVWISGQLKDEYESKFEYGKSVEQLDYNVQIRNKPKSDFFGDWSDGDLFVPTGSTKTLSPWTYNYRRIIIDGTLTGDSYGTYVLRGNSEVSINWDIDFSSIAYSYESASSAISTYFGSLTTGVTWQGWTGGGSDYVWAAAWWVWQSGYGGGWRWGFVQWTPSNISWGAGGSGGTANNPWGGQILMNQTLLTNGYGWNAAWSSWGGGGGGAMNFTWATFTTAQSGTGWVATEWANGSAWEASFLSNLTAGTALLGGWGGGGGSPWANGANLVCYFSNLSWSGTISTNWHNWYSGGAGWAGNNGNSGGGGWGGGWLWGALAVYYTWDASSITTSNTAWSGGTGGTYGWPWTWPVGNNWSAWTSGTKTIVDVSAL